MKRFREIDINPERARGQSVRLASVDALASELETNGVVGLPPLLSADQLGEMQEAFAARLRRVRWNNFDGPNYQLTEAKGWKSLPTNYDFHGWHGDMWYEQHDGAPIHREIKLAMYLTDVRSGAFNFIKGTHQKQHPHNLKRDEVNALPLSELVELKGDAGTIFMFDTSIIHRQSIPMLEPRQAIFYAYHDPGVVLQKEDVAYYRYHPLLLNAAFLGDLSEEDQRILGFGDKRNFQPAFVREDQPSLIYRMYSASLGAQVRIQDLRERISARLQRMK
jgi:Phytanoyl-CoA dioxygenase (PhyH)